MSGNAGNDVPGKRLSDESGVVWGHVLGVPQSRRAFRPPQGVILGTQTPITEQWGALDDPPVLSLSWIDMNRTKHITTKLHHEYDDKGITQIISNAHSHHMHPKKGDQQSVTDIISKADYIITASHPNQECKENIGHRRSIKYSKEGREATIQEGLKKPTTYKHIVSTQQNEIRNDQFNVDGTLLSDDEDTNNNNELSDTEDYNSTTSESSYNTDTDYNTSHYETPRNNTNNKRKNRQQDSTNDNARKRQTNEQRNNKPTQPPTPAPAPNRVNENNTWSTHGILHNPAQGFLSTSSHNGHILIHHIYTGEKHRSSETEEAKGTATSLIYAMMQNNTQALSYQTIINTNVEHSQTAINMFTNLGFKATTNMSNRINKNKLRNGYIHLYVEASKLTSYMECLLQEHQNRISNHNILHHDTPYHNKHYMPITLKQIIHEANTYNEQHTKHINNTVSIHHNLCTATHAYTAHDPRTTYTYHKLNLDIDLSYIQTPPILNHNTHGIPITYTMDIPQLENEIIRLYNHGADIYNNNDTRKDILAQVRRLDDYELQQRTRRLPPTRRTEDKVEIEEPCRRQKATFRWNERTLATYINRHRRSDDDIT